MKNESYHEYLPTVENVDWMIKNGVARCEGCNKPFGCKLGSKCCYVHVHKPLGAFLNHVEGISVEELKCIASDKYIKKISILGGNGKTYHTAAFRSSNHVVYYAEKGRNWELSKQGLYWYPDATSAEDAVRRVVAVARNIPKQISLPALPILIGCAPC